MRTYVSHSWVNSGSHGKNRFVRDCHIAFREQLHGFTFPPAVVLCIFCSTRSCCCPGCDHSSRFCWWWCGESFWFCHPASSLERCLLSKVFAIFKIRFSCGWVLRVPSIFWVSLYQKYLILANIPLDLPFYSPGIVFIRAEFVFSWFCHLICLCMWMHACHGARVKVRGQLSEVWHLLLPCGLWRWTLVLSLGGKNLNPLSYLTGPENYNFNDIPTYQLFHVPYFI